MDQEKAIARLEALMLLAAREADAAHAALFVPAGEGLSLVTQIAIDQAALDLTHAAWARHRGVLSAGGTVRYGCAAVWPILHTNNLVALVYLDSAPPDFPDDSAQQHGLMLSSSLVYLTPRTPASTYLTCGLPHPEAILAMEEDRLAIALRVYRGNVAAVARYFGVRRETIYERAARADIDINEFRLRPKRLVLKPA